MGGNLVQLGKEEIRVKGKPIEVASLQIDGKVILITGKAIKIAKLKEEWYEDVESPASIAKQLENSRATADIFTFWQRLPDTEPKFQYHTEWESIAALPIKTYDYWLSTQVDSNTRRGIKKAEKKGVEVKTANFDDEFVRGITNIFGETPIRQGKPFWHYKKNFETVKLEMADRLDKSDFIGAYYNGELIGFIKLLDAGKYADMVEILSKVEHWDKSPNNVLIARAVELCVEKGIPYLVYSLWPRGSLGEFKRRNGFEKIDLPRYYIPVTLKGKVALRLGLHHGIKDIIPERWKDRLVEVRRKYYINKFTEST